MPDGISFLVGFETASIDAYVLPGEVGAICRRSGGGYDTLRTPDYQPESEEEIAGLD